MLNNTLCGGIFMKRRVWVIEETLGLSKTDAAANLSYKRQTTDLDDLR